LAGKDLWLCASAGSSEDSYRAMPGTLADAHPFDAFLPPYRQTAALTRMRWLPPSVFFHAHQAAQQSLDTHVADLLARLQAYPEGLDDTPWALPGPVEGERPLEGGV
jgi:glutathione-regulated potassium-efflux system ancillary protein KefF